MKVNHSNVAVDDEHEHVGYKYELIIIKVNEGNVLHVNIIWLTNVCLKGVYLLCVCFRVKTTLHIY